jgi:hypothetical protein
MTELLSSSKTTGVLVRGQNMNIFLLILKEYYYV